MLRIACAHTFVCVLQDIAFAAGVLECCVVVCASMKRNTFCTSNKVMWAKHFEYILNTIVVLPGGKVSPNVSPSD